jgi:hypothetical protein
MRIRRKRRLNVSGAESLNAHRCNCYSVFGVVNILHSYIEFYVEISGLALCFMMLYRILGVLTIKTLESVGWIASQGPRDF